MPFVAKIAATVIPKIAKTAVGTASKIGGKGGKPKLDAPKIGGPKKGRNTDLAEVGGDKVKTHVDSKSDRLADVADVGGTVASLAPLATSLRTPAPAERYGSYQPQFPENKVSLNTDPNAGVVAKPAAAVVESGVKSPSAIADPARPALSYSPTNLSL